ncbi:GPI anchored protein, putative [Talaromyces stipitatus ATCC 10500]|uniref:GPI anchored protein, putative n=1 Tax=Talaromyces stipitatus (strain ATCC 10500 / CBS 375.48 / QM 6759 / NRRL 1006) TaxID=441959 RepID=B8M2J1_TALSN|nr:GPI anchored protein, putative [Talaromyces stipitatus ATCC 10500]EED21902.1 GPI anchored protein, putative [Talaromyces stipitatus ATCC 10500]
MKFSTLVSVLAATTAANAAYINYTTVTGYFFQDEPSTDPSTFVYYKENFGLINRTYPGEKNGGWIGHGQTQWQKFYHEVLRLNRESPENVQYKVFFFGRHGEGYHNAAESFYGTPAWNCYWAELNGNSTNTWHDAALTANGVAQAQIAHNFWQDLINNQKIHTPDAYYVSPLTRCLQTANVTFTGLDLPHSGAEFKPTVKELLREGISIHTCDNRRNKTYIHDLFPEWQIEDGFAETDELWNGISEETSDAEAVRSKKVLDEIFTELTSFETSACEPSPENLFISVTSHSGQIGSLLSVLGHRKFSLSTGAVIPVLVRAEYSEKQVATTCLPWAVSPHCTAPPQASVSACVCAGGATPVTTPLVSVTARPPTVTGPVCY